MKTIKAFAGVLLSVFVFSPMLQGASWTAYIADSTNGTNGILDVFNITTNSLQSPILDPAGNYQSIAVTPDNKTAYVVQNSAGLVPIDLTTGQPGTPIPLGTFALGRVGITPNGQTAFVTGAAIPAELIRVDLATQTVTHIPLTGGNPFGVAITPDGSKVYVSNVSNGVVEIVDVATNTIDPASPIPVNSGPFDLAITPNGQRLYVVCTGSAMVDVIDLATNTVVDSIPIPITLLGAFINAIAITPDGTLAYVGVNIDQKIVPIDLSTNTTKDPIQFNPAQNQFPTGIAFTPDGTTAFVANQDSNTLVKISGVKTTTPQVVSTTNLTTGGAAQYLAISTDQAPTARFSFLLASPGFPSTFDASASSSPVGSIASYRWNFGDGSPVVTTTDPVVTHTYNALGNFTVTLTVTNTGGTSTTRTFTGQTVSNNGRPRARLSQTIEILAVFVFPPTNVRGNQVKEKFATQTDIINVLKWTAPSTGNPPVAFRIYRDAALTQLIGTTRAHQFVFEDHNRHPHIAYTYYIVSVDEAGEQSTPAVLTVSPS